MDSVSTPSVSYSQGPGTTFPLGATQVTATATDASGNTAMCTFTVTVRDTTAPQLTCPPNQEAFTSAPSGIAVTYSEATATDAVSTATVAYSHASGATFPMGETAVTVTAVDAAGNPATCTFTVTVSKKTGGCGCTTGSGELPFGALAMVCAALLRKGSPRRRVRG